MVQSPADSRFLDICPKAGVPRGGRILFFSSEVTLCTKTRHLYAETAVRNSFSPPVSRSSTQKRDLPTSLKHVRHAVWHANRRADPKESFTRLSAQNAAERLRFPLSPTTTALSFAAHAMLKNLRLRNNFDTPITITA